MRFGLLPEVEGFILAGGASSRMGKDKSRLRLGGQTFVELTAKALAPVVTRVSVVSSRHDAAEIGLRVIPDVFENCGALGGLHAALRAARTDWVVILSCDLPFITADLIRELVSHAVDETDAVAPLQEDGRSQPLCAVYARSRGLALAEELLRSGDLRPRELLARARTFWVAPAVWNKLPGAELFFENINTPEDYQRALASVRDTN